MEHGLFSIDFNRDNCSFSDTVSHLDNLFIKKQHLSVSSIKNVWDKSESDADQLFPLFQGHKCERTISIVIRLVSSSYECMIFTVSLEMMLWTMDCWVPFCSGFPAFGSQASLTPMTKTRRKMRGPQLQELWKTPLTLEMLPKLQGIPRLPRQGLAAAAYGLGH